MKKQITILLGSILLLTAAMASAQTSQKVIVSVPFAFVAGGQTLPSGVYTIDLNREAAMVLSRENQRGHISTVMVLANGSSQTPDYPYSYATFQRYGSHYFLTSVWRVGAGQTIPPGKLERELAKKQRSDQKLQIEARLSDQ